MLCDPAGGRVPVHDRLEQMADERVQDDQPMQRDPEREPDHTDQSQWCPGGFDQVLEATCLEATPAGDH